MASEEKIEKILEIDQLFRFYGPLLTDKQRQYMHFYYDENLSLGEIAEALNVSRQAVHLCLKTSEKLLHQYENQLNFIKKFVELNQITKEFALVSHILINDKKTDPITVNKLEKIQNKYQKVIDR